MLGEKGGAFLNGKEGFCPPETGEPKGGVKTIEGRFSKKDIIYLYTYYRSTSDTPQK